MLKCIYRYKYIDISIFPGDSDGKESDCSEEDPGSIPGLGRCPGAANGNTLQYLAWRIPWTEEPGRLQSMGSQRVGHNWETQHSTACLKCSATDFKFLVELPVVQTIN